MTDDPPFLRVTKPYLPGRDAYDGFLEGIWERSWVTNGGPLEDELAARMVETFGLSHLQLTSSGTSALQVALAALDLGGEVIVTPYSFPATLNALLRQGCVPVFADIETGGFGLDPAAIAAAITPRTKGILATTVYGLPCDFAGIADVADTHGLPVIYDHAHSVGSTLNGRPLITQGTVSAISLHATKVFHTVEGGGVLTADPEIDRRVRFLKANGIAGDEVPMVGLNAKMSEFHAAMGLAILPRFEAMMADRRAVFGAYREGLDGLPLRLVSGDGFDGLDWNHAYCPILLRDAQTTIDLQRHLADRRIEGRRYFRPALNGLHGRTPGDCPVAEDICERILCLPMGPHLTGTDIARVTDAIRSFL